MPSHQGQEQRLLLLVWRRRRRRAQEDGRPSFEASATYNVSRLSEVEIRLPWASRVVAYTAEEEPRQAVRTETEARPPQIT